MLKGTYCGDIQELQGETALLRPAKAEGFVLAQFDNQNLAVKATMTEIAPRDSLINVGFGWHVFKSGDFESKADRADI